MNGDDSHNNPESIRGRPMAGAQWLKGLLLLLLVIALVQLCWAADQNNSNNPPRMEVFGIGPELFSDRGIAWVKAIAAVIKEAIGELGLIALAIYALQKNLKSQNAVQEVKDELGGRLDRHDQRIAQAELATMPGATAEPGGAVRIPRADVEIQPQPERTGT